jgi:predicted dehydrogenase
VLPDLGSHLLDTALFWFGEVTEDFSVLSARCFENRAPDHVVIGARGKGPQLEFEMTLLSWRNHFTCDLFAEKGSAHIRSLCNGVRPPSRCARACCLRAPAEDYDTLEQPDPDLGSRVRAFQVAVREPRPADLARDLWLQRMLRKLGDQAVR